MGALTSASSSSRRVSRRLVIAHCSTLAGNGGQRATFRPRSMAALDDWTSRLSCFAVATRMPPAPSPDLLRAESAPDTSDRFCRLTGPTAHDRVGDEGLSRQDAPRVSRRMRPRRGRECKSTPLPWMLIDKAPDSLNASGLSSAVTRPRRVGAKAMLGEGALSWQGQIAMATGGRDLHLNVPFPRKQPDLLMAESPSTGGLSALTGSQ